jgi:lambda family phage minor tail protein L
MGQGQDKIASSLIDLQPTAIVEFFILEFNPEDKPNERICFHGGGIFEKEIKWQNETYRLIPVESEGFEVTANGQLPRPKLRISNKGYLFTDLLLKNNDFQFARIRRKRTFVKYLNDDNFDGGNPWGQADPSAELSNDTFVIGQKTAENKLFIELELTSPLDLENFEVNSRLLMSRYCSWYYRGNGCNYAGPPLETEYGARIELNNASVNNWKDLTTKNKWVTGQYYSSGEPVFVENTKIIINPIQKLNTEKKLPPEYAKIWYVSQQNHTATSDNGPSVSETYWMKDGCNKKLNGCKKRFQSSEIQVLPSAPYTVSGYFANFTHKIKNNSNNIASQATITGSTVASGSAFRNAIDSITGSAENKTLDSGVAWISTGAADPWLKLTWDSMRDINRVDIYDRYNSAIDFKEAKITFYSGATAIKSGNLNINNAGARTTTGFNAIQADSLMISGINSETNAGLAEVAVFEPSGLGLYNDTFKTSGIHASDDLHIATWFQFPSGVTRSDQLLNIFHNVKTNNQYSGINLYASGNDNLVLNFSTVLVSGAGPSYIVSPKTLTIPWDCKSLLPIHLETYGGKTSGVNPTGLPEGYIQVSNGESDPYRYTLAVKNSDSKVSGEFFLFKNTSYTGGMDNLFFSVNNWQFSTGDVFTPAPQGSVIGSNIQLTSSLKLGTTAIWTGQSGIEERKTFFNRESSNIWNESQNQSLPRNYEELLSGNNILQTGLFAWWDMNFSDTPTYQIEASNDSSQKIYLSGNYTESIEEAITGQFTSKETKIGQTFQNYLPFGGFPGTDRYGR